MYLRSAGLPIPRPRPPRPMRYRVRRGFGDVSAQDIGSLAAQGAATTGTILAGLASPSIAALSPAFAAAGPIGIAVAGLTMLGFAIASQFHGCGQTCVAATDIANKVATYLEQNLKTYMDAPVHYASMQAAALNNFDFGLNALIQGCSNPALGDAGRRCISERIRGGASNWCCASPVSVRVGDSDCNKSPCCTGCDMYVSLRDPIANDPNVVPDPSPIAGAAGDASASLLSAAGFNPSTQVLGFKLSDLLLPAGLLFLAWVLPEGGRD